MRTLIAGVSTRAIAESAVRSSDQLITLDYFGDRDQRAMVENYALCRDWALPFSARALLQASRSLDYDAVAYISNLENYPDVVKEMAQGRILLGNTPAVLRQVRNWQVLREFCHSASIPCPFTLLPGEEGQAEPGAIAASGHRSAETRWLHKPVCSGGGRGICFWDGAQPLDEMHVLQKYVAGVPASAAFVANGHRSVVIGLTEQLIGQEVLGTGAFSWCGNILPLAAADEGAAILERVQRMADELTARFGLAGLNGMDLVIAGEPLHGLRLFMVEVNPRYTASMELVERAYGLGVWSLHLAALQGQLPAFSLVDRLDGPFFAKGIVYARSTVTMPDTEGWTTKGRRDIPYPGERIEAGHPICTVLAEGETRQSCWNHLLVGAEALRQEIGAARGGLS